MPTARPTPQSIIETAKEPPDPAVAALLFNKGGVLFIAVREGSSSSSEKSAEREEKAKETESKQETNFLERPTKTLFLFQGCIKKENF